MRKKRAMLWLLLCGACVVGSTSYLSKIESLKATEKSEVTETKKIASIAKIKAIDKTALTIFTNNERTSDIPLLDPKDYNFSITENPYFTEWNDNGTPAGWDSPRNVLNTYPTPYDENNYNQYFQQESRVATTDWYNYINWQRIRGGGINTLKSYTDQYSDRGMTPVLISKNIPYNKDLGSVFTVMVDAQRSTMPLDIFKSPINFKGNWIKTGDYSVKVSLAVPTGGDNSAEVMKNDLKDVRGVKTIQMSLTKTQLDLVTGDNPKNLSLQGSSFANSVQWNYLSVYQTNTVLTLNSEAENAFTLLAGQSFTNKFTRADFTDLIGGGSYTTIGENNEVTKVPLSEEDLKQLEFKGILGETYPDTSRVSTQQMALLYQGVVNGVALNAVVNVPLTVTWGNSVALGGGTSYPDGMSSLAFSLVKEVNQYQLNANNGNGTYDTVPVNSANPNDIYYQVDYFSPAADGETLNLNQDLTNTGTANLTVKGSDTPNELIQDWGTNGKLDVELGGVLRVYMSDPTKEWLYQNDELNAQFKPNNLPQKNYVFYQVTENGLEPMYNNKVETDNTVANVPKIGYDAPASAVNVAFDSEPDKHLKKINDVDYTGIHFSWNFSRGTTTTDQGKTIDIPASVTGKSMNPDIAIEFPIQPDPKVQVLKEEYETWLPDFPDRWRNSMTESIPKQNAFVMMEMVDTEIVDYDLPKNNGDLIPGSAGTGGKAYQIYSEAKKPSWIKIKNVGIYDGKSVGVKVTVVPTAEATANNDSAYIGYAGTAFLDIAITKEMQSADVQYEFFDSKTEEPLAISAYWTISRLNLGKTFTIGLDDFKDIYSIDRYYSVDGIAKPIRVKYSENIDEGTLTLLGTTTREETEKAENRIQEKVTFTINDVDHFNFRITSTEENTYNNLRITYENGTDAFVEIPDPVGETQVFDTIAANNYPDQAGKIKDPLNVKFYQYIPYESERNRGRSIEWTVPEEMDGSVIKNGDWIVTDETDMDVSNRFIIDEGKMVPKDGQDESFYNHYYFFQKNLVIDDQKPIEESALSVKDEQGHRYFDYRGEITLEAQGFDPVSSDFHSKINFAAEAEFEPVYRDKEDNDTIKPIPDSSAQIEKDLLITHNYQEITPPAIDGYEYADESIPENYTELPVRYTQAEDNKVQLVYEKEEELGGELFFDIPEEMNFQKVSIPTVFQKTEYLQTIDPDWAIKVTDERSEKQRTPWKLSAQIADQSFYTHTDSEYQGQKADSEYEENIPLMSNILRFANADGATNDLTQSVVIYDSGDEPQAYDEYPIQWTDKNTGFFLDLQAFGYYPEGKYRATIDFTVEYVE